MSAVDKPNLLFGPKLSKSRDLEAETQILKLKAQQAEDQLKIQELEQQALMLQSRIKKLEQMPTPIAAKPWPVVTPKNSKTKESLQDKWSQFGKHPGAGKFKTIMGSLLVANILMIMMIVFSANTDTRAAVGTCLCILFSAGTIGAILHGIIEMGFSGGMSVLKRSVVILFGAATVILWMFAVYYPVESVNQTERAAKAATQKIKTTEAQDKMKSLSKATSSKILASCGAKAQEVFGTQTATFLKYAAQDGAQKTEEKINKAYADILVGC